MNVARVAHLTTVDVSLRYLLLAQMEAAREAGWDVVGISAGGPHVAAIEAAGIRHVALPTSTRGMDIRADIRAAAELWRVLRRERPDVLHTHNPKPGVYGRIVGRLAGVPVVVNTIHGLFATPDDRLVKRAIVYALEAVAHRFSDAELVQNPEDLALLTRWRITRPARTRLLGNGVDLRRFDPDRFPPGTRQQVRRELGIGEDQVVIGTVGRLVAEKGLPELFEAAARLPDRFALVVIGPDDPEKADALPPSVIEEARAAGVRLLGMRTDVERLYLGMDVFVLASHREGYPRAAMEAAAMGLPVVATDIRGCRQVVEPGVTGALVPVRDADALREAILRLGDDPANRRSMGAAGRALARERFDEDHVVATVLDTYRAVARRKRRPLPARQGAA